MKKKKNIPKYCQTCGEFIGSGKELRKKIWKILPDCTDICSINNHTLHRILELEKKLGEKK